MKNHLMFQTNFLQHVNICFVFYLIVISGVFNTLYAAELSTIPNTNSGLQSNKTSLSNLIEPMVPLGHTDSIFAVEFSADGRLAFSLSKDQTLKVWEVSTGREVKRYRMQSDHVKTLAVSPNGYWVVTGGVGKTIKLWDVATGNKIQIFSGHARQVNALAFSPDGKYLISAGNDRLIKRWDIKTANLIGKYRAHRKPIKTLSYSRDGQWIASAGEEKEIYIWNVNENKPQQKLKGHKNTILSVKFSPNGHYLASTGEDKQIILWDWKQRKLLKIFNGHLKSINSIDFSSDSRYLISASDDKTMRLWDIEENKEIRLFNRHTEKVITARFSPNDKFILSGSTDITLRLWGTKSANQIFTLKGFATLANSVAYSPDGQYVFSAHNDRTMKLWNMTTGQNIRIFSRHKDSVNSLAFSNNGKTVVSGSSDHTVKLWNLEDGTPLQHYKGHAASVNQVLFTPDNTHILSASADKTIKLWNIKEDKLTKDFVGHSRSVTAISFSPDGNTFLSASKDKTFRQWDVHSGNSTIINETSSPINSIRYSDNGKFAVTAGWELILWSMPSTKISHKFIGHTAEINDIAISKDGNKLISASWDNTLKLWDIETGALIREFKAHYGGVKSVAFSANDQRIISAGVDGTLKLWDIKSGQEIITMVAANNGEWITLTTDGYYEHSPEGVELIHWVERESTESYSFEQFEKQFNKPDIIRARLANQKSSGSPAPNINIPPKMELVEHLQSFLVEEDKVTLNIKVIDNELIKNLRVFVNGKLLLNKKDIPQNQDISLTIPLYSGANQITAMAYNKFGLASEPRHVSVYSTNAEDNKNNLHILSVGVSQYKKLPEEMQLSYAHIDADNFIKRINTASSNLYNTIHTQYLANENASQQTILEGLDNLSQTDKDDLVMIFFAGHGTQDEDTGIFYLVTHDTDVDNLAETAINWSLISQHISNIKSRVIIFIDACHSGSISNQTIVPNNELAEKFFSNEQGGVMVYSAAKGRQYAMESESFGQGEGLFSYAISKALSKEGQQADHNGNGFIEFSEMVKFVRQFVDDFSDGQQTPWLSHKEMFGDLPIATVVQE